MKRILVTGSRDWDAPYWIHQMILTEVLQKPGIVVHGGAKGADSIAGAVARMLMLPVEVHPADWDKHGKRAGYIRNKEMVDAGADVCLAFIRNKSRGATMCAQLAEKAGIPVKYFRVDEP